MPHLSRNGLLSKFRSFTSRDAETKGLSALSILISIGAAAALTGQYPARAADLQQASVGAAHATKHNAISSKPQPNKRSKGLIANVQVADKNDVSTATSDSDVKKVEKSDKTAEDNVYAQQYFADERQARKRKYAHSSSTVLIYAPQAVVWKVLIDFERYPEIFKRIESCHITKNEHGLLFAESYLKPQMFVKKLCQHTVTDISQGPRYLQWKMLDGNFTAVLGSWTLVTTTDKKNKPVCSATYTLEADPGPVIPGPMVSFLLHQIEHEVVTSFKKACEAACAEQANKTVSMTYDQ